MPHFEGTTLRRVCFQLDELVELRTYVQIEAEDVSRDAEFQTTDGRVPTVRDMTKIDPYASSTPLDRADLYMQCCKVYKIPPLQAVCDQLREKGPPNAPYEGPRVLQLRNVDLSTHGAIALADCLGLPLTGKHLTEVVFDNCGLNDTTLQWLLSCLYTSAKISILQVDNNPQITLNGIKSILCFLCLSPQVTQFKFGGSRFDSECMAVLTELLSDSRIRALQALEFRNPSITAADLQQLLPAAQRAGVVGYAFESAQLNDDSLQLIGSMLSGPNAILYLHLPRNNFEASFQPIIDGLHETSPLISLELQSCNLSKQSLAALLRKIKILPNFRRLKLCGQDLRPLMPILREILPNLPILRRLGLSHSQLESQDIVVLCEVLGKAKVSELILTGIKFDASALSALYAFARVSKTLVNLEIDIPNTAIGEKLSRRILAECIRNMENQEASLQFTDTDVHSSVILQHRKLRENARPVDRTDDLHDGGHGIASALGSHLDTTEEDVAKDVPLDMLDRARHIRGNIEPALAEALPELQRRRLLLVAETLDKVIKRFEDTYPECKPEVRQGPEDEAIYEHTGRPRPAFVAPRINTATERSRRLGTEEGEVMKLSHRMTDRMNVLRLSAPNSASPSTGPSRGELEDQAEAAMLEKMNLADGGELKNRLYELQKSGYGMERKLGGEIA